MDCPNKRVLITNISLRLPLYPQEKASALKGSHFQESRLFSPFIQIDSFNFSDTQTYDVRYKDFESNTLLGKGMLDISTSPSKLIFISSHLWYTKDTRYHAFILIDFMSI